MPRSLLFAVILIALSVPACLFGTEAAPAADEVEWSDTARDIWLDGEARPDVRVLASRDPDRMALVLSDELVLVVDTDEGVVSTLSPADLIDAADALHATSPEPTPAGDGTRAVALPEGWWIEHGGQHILVGPHQGPAGPLDRQDLWAAAPRWHAATEAYTPTPAAVEALRQVDRPVELTVAFGTWCGDSRRSVPRLMAALDAAANPNLSVDLVAIGRGFDDPLATVRDLQVTNVPTVIAYADGQEIGRFVERPLSDNVETDLAAILSDGELVGDPRFADSDRLLAKGSYALHAPGGERVGTERFALYATEDGGQRLHAVLDDPAGAVEIWQRLDSDQRTGFVEITRRVDGRELSRTRLNTRDGLVRSTTRGDATGIIRQVAALPDGAVVGLPVASAVGTLWSELGRPAAGHAFETFFWSGPGRPSAGRLESANLTPRGVDGVEVGAKTIEALRFDLTLSEAGSSWWLHPDLGLPLRGTLDTGARVVLDAFELAAEPAGSAR